MDFQTSQSIRKKISNRFSFYNSHQHNRTYFDSIININLQKTKNFLKKHPDLLVTKADKGNCTILIDKHDYIQKVKIALQTYSTYNIVNKDPLPQFKKRVKLFLNTWLQRGIFDNTTFPTNINSLLDEFCLSRAYGLLKVHKLEIPARIVVSTLNSSLYIFDKWLSIFLKKHCITLKYSLNNSLQLKSKISDITIPSTHRLVSFDIVAMFPSLPHIIIINLNIKDSCHVMCLPAFRYVIG